MELKRYEEITGREAIERLSNGLNIFDRSGTEVKLDFEKMDYVFVTKNGDTGFGRQVAKESKLNLTQILKWTWYVKKPFDVRAEMLARPNEWVGAIKNTNKEWMAIGFDTSKFTVSVRYFNDLSDYLPNDGSSGGYGIAKATLDQCIPIEDVPEEEI